MDNLDTKGLFKDFDLDLALSENFEELQECYNEFSEHNVFKNLLDEADDDAVFKTHAKQLLESKNLHQSPLQVELPSPMMLIKDTASASHVQPASSIKPSAPLDLFNQILTVVYVHVKDGVEETTFTFAETDPVLSGVEISIKNYDQAYGMLNIEIKTCDKLQALLHKHKEGLIHVLEKNCPQVSVHRLEFSLKSEPLRNDKIAGTSMKKVTKSEMGSHDNQA